MPIKAKNPYRIRGDGTVEITLTKGKTALIDERDLPLVGRYRWNVCLVKGGGWLIVSATDPKEGKKYSIMSHIILAVTAEILINHKNDDTLDCRRRNLRICSRTQASQNRKIQKHSSRYKGVSWHKRHKKWMASICILSKLKFLGYFNDESAAAQAYDEQARKHFGEFARPNFPERMKEAS